MSIIETEPPIAHVQAALNGKHMGAHQQIMHCMEITRSWYEKGAARISIATLPEFTTPEELGTLLKSISDEHVRYVHGMLTGQRIPLPESMGKE